MSDTVSGLLTIGVLVAALAIVHVPLGIFSDALQDGESPANAEG